MTADRIVSLIASATEIVCALGLEDRLVGRSHECDFPRSITKLPACTGPKFDVQGTSREIDARVKSLVADALSVYRVDAEMLRGLLPDLIVTQSQCRVCAVSLDDVEAAVGGWVESRPRIVSLEPNALTDVWSDILRVAEAAGHPESGRRLIAGLQERMRRIEEQAAAPVLGRPTVACIEWIDPLMAAGNWMPELVAMAGGRSLFGEAGKHSPWMTWEQLVAADPDIVVILPCGFDIERSRQDMSVLTTKPGWSELSAVRTERVFLTDGNQYFNRPGPRLVESLEILAELFHPGTFRFGHRGSGWEPLTGSGA